MSKTSKILAELARRDINIFNVHKEGDALVVEYEYGWHPDSYKTKWTKAVYIVGCVTTPLDEVYEHILREVQCVRRELEGGGYER